MSELAQPASRTHILSCVCAKCEKCFTGKYCKGNLRRHIRHVHASSQPDQRLQCEVCFETFNRTDAKNIHKRRFHDNRNGNARAGDKVKRRRESLPQQMNPVGYNSEQIRPGSAGTLLKNPIPGSMFFKGSILFEQPKVPLSGTGECAHDVRQRVCALVERLNAEYASEILEKIVGFLRILQDDLSQRQTCRNDLVALGLSTALSLVLDSFKIGSARSNIAHDSSRKIPLICNQDPSSSSTPQVGTTNVSGTIDLNPAFQAVVHHDMAARPKQHRQRTKEAGQFACPARKHSDIYGERCSCSFQGKPSMWGVTYHLKQRDHKSEHQFLAQCNRCWTYYQADSSPNGCPKVHEFPETQSLPQPRGAGQVKQWFELYRTLYPGHKEPENPYVDEPFRALRTPPSDQPRLTSLQQRTVSMSLPSNFTPPPVDQVSTYPVTGANSGCNALQSGFHWPSTMSALYEIAAFQALESVLVPSESGMYDEVTEFMRGQIAQDNPPPLEHTLSITNHFLAATNDFVWKIVAAQQQHNTSTTSSHVPTTTFGPPNAAHSGLPLNMIANLPHSRGFEQFGGQESIHVPLDQGSSSDTFDYDASLGQIPHNWWPSQH